MTRSSSPHDVGELRARLLASGRSEKPSDKLMRRTMAAIGAGAAAGLGTAGSAGATTSLLARAFFWKWMGLGVIGGALTIGAWRVATPAPHTPTAALSAPSQITSARQADPSPSAAVASAPVPSSSAAARAAATSAPVQTPSAPASAPRSPGLVDEIAQLDEARRAMAAGDSSAALRALDRHAREFPASQLDHEAAVLRVESMMAAGQCDAARAQAGSFLRANPRSPVAPRMTTLMTSPCSATR